MIMKKYLLAVLALGATMMMACQPADDNGGKGGNGGNPAPVIADYNLTSDVAGINIEGYLDYYGNEYKVGNSFNLEVTAVETNANGVAIAKMLVMQFTGELSNKTGVGTYTPATINWETGEGLKVNTYWSAAELDGEIAGCGYAEANTATEEMTAYEGIVSGDLTVAKDGENYVIKGLFTTLSGKTLKVDLNCPLEYGDYSE